MKECVIVICLTIHSEKIFTQLDNSETERHWPADARVAIPLTNYALVEGVCNLIQPHDFKINPRDDEKRDFEDKQHGGGLMLKIHIP